MMNLTELETLLATIPGVNVKLPPHLQPPFRAKPVIAVRGYENFDRNELIDPVVGFTCPDGHRAVINLIAIAVNFDDQEATWTSPLYDLQAYKNNQRYEIINPAGTIPPALYDPQSDNLIILANEASVPVAGVGAVVSGLNDNPFGLTNMVPVQILLDSLDTIRFVYDGRAGTSTEGHNLYMKLAGWLWARQEEAEGNIGT